MTSVKFDNPASEELVDTRLKSISAYLESKDSIYACFVYGMGKKYRSAYDKLGDLPGVEIVWTKSTLPKFIGFLSHAVASHEGLLQIKDPSQLPIVFAALTDQSMAGVYCVRPQMVDKFNAGAVSGRHNLSLINSVEHDSHYFTYIVDADNDESPTGIYEVVCYGPDAPIGDLGFVAEGQGHA